MSKPRIPDFNRPPDSTKRLAIDAITTRSLQQRCHTDQATVNRYAAIYETGGLKALPPITVVFDVHAVSLASNPTARTTYWLADGHHRLAAARKAGFTQIECEIFNGDKRDVVLVSAQRNAGHGLPLSNDDKRALVATLLADPEWCQWSDREIARQLRVGADLVGKVRPTVDGAQSEKRKGKDGRVIAKRGTSDKAKLAAGAKAQAPTPAASTPTDAGIAAPPANSNPSLAGGPGTTHNEPPEPPTLGPDGITGEPVPPVVSAPSIPTSKPRADLADRRLKAMVGILGEQLLAYHDWKGTPDEALALCLLVGHASQRDSGVRWTDDLISNAFNAFTTNLRSEVHVLLTDGDTHGLPELATICRLWGIDHDALRIRAERAVTE